MSVKTFTKGAAYWIVLDNAKRANSITEKMYDQINRGLDEANKDPNTFLTVFTGEGNYYSSGNDFSSNNNFSAAEAAKKDVEIGFSKWVRRLIDHEKVVIGLVNGPAMGMSATTLGLMDYVVCTDKTYFHLPFPILGVCPEAGASEILPSILGVSKANEMMLFGERMEADEALARGFVGKVWAQDEFKTRGEELVEKYSKLPRHSVLASKSLIRGAAWRQRMRGVAETELDTLRSLFASDETARRIGEKFAKKKN